ncbi:FAD-binding monooxygenase [Herbiconiux sp. VKM Ac-2851]|uniref:FAD-binding monooxygenase n=1 Tax=Herbiconiux sp. VKM Ac-2851 TaxID=2739025 RepID=UPI0015645B94|nr:FAD-binding monooxygenase [Herbiconiux sp. VKM Ac-2851]NQX37001.1 FAD-dependent monooxygenase [Herbiconiux sp. VKM Ac-2851]
MQFHHHGYVSGDPRIAPAAGTGIDRPALLPDEVDVLIVGSGPAGMILAAQLAQFPEIHARVIERRPGRLAIGQADGIQARSVETFQAFGFAERITAEAYQISEMAFWSPDPADPSRIHRSARAVDDATGVSEFPHLIVNQARVLDYFAEAMHNAPARMEVDYGYEFVTLAVEEGREHPVAVTLRETAGEREGLERQVRAKYVVGCDGARSGVREAIGRSLVGASAAHAWAVMDTLAVTDFPDIRTKCAIQSQAGSILHIPREGGHLFRMYVDLGEVAPGDNGAVRRTTVETAIEKANAILHPYTLDVKDVAWYSVYEVGHRLTDKFDEVPEGDDRCPHVFITGDACHTHSAKAGQGMNVSMQDGFNLGWKLAHVLTGRASEELLKTYSAERQVIAKNLIDFDKEWSTLMAKKPEEFENPEELADFYVRTAEFPAGFMTQYPPSMLIGGAEHQALAEGIPIGKRFKSAPVVRVADGNPIHLGHHARADGRWRLYAFPAASSAGGREALGEWAEWLEHAPDSPLIRHTPAGAEPDSVFDVKVVYPEPHVDVDISTVPTVFLPRTGPFGLIDYEKVYAADPAESITTLRGLDPATGCVVVVRPDQYVAHVLPLTATAELSAFFAGAMLEGGAEAGPGAETEAVAGSLSGSRG